MANEMGVVIVEDHCLLADGLCQLFERVLNWRVLARVENGLEVYRACQTHQPDLVVLDLGLPGMDGVEVIRQCRQRWPALKIVVHSACGDIRRARGALDAGALSYVLKSSRHETMLTAARLAVAGRTFVDPALMASGSTHKLEVAGADALTHRELQVLKLIAEGHRNRDVAEALSISVKTVETHRLNLMRKIDAHSVADVVNSAHRLGLIV
ncbi:DNA-binding response regulator [Pandoraea terrae]|uniref:DNA-binding response regulator n=1 Tax=Pandoraea terrae TaxID=1537710 RepID=A0A5E4ZDK5_9BURK|nr:two component system response regulator [Pandoraea terrae]VVE59164.1 DNA-binding response regulator [Pandoraea terrae]